MWFTASKIRRNGLKCLRSSTIRPWLEILEDRCCPSGGSLNQAFGSGGIVGNVRGGRCGRAIQRRHRQRRHLQRQLPNCRHPRNPNGRLDKTLTAPAVDISVDAKFSTLEGVLLLQPDGKILIGGWAYSNKLYSDSEFVVARVNANGSLDTTFGSGGLFTWSVSSGSDYVHALAFLPNGDILVAGSSNLNGTCYSLFRLKPTGKLDKSFGNQGNGLAAVHIGSNSTERRLIRWCSPPMGTPSCAVPTVHQELK